jgi:putative RecB family exonuclease
MRELAARVLETFQASEFAKPTETIVAVEESMRGEFVHGMPDVLTRVDLAVQDGDELVLTDFKTSRGRWNINQTQSNAEQLLLSADLAGRVLDGKRINLQFAVITKTKTPVLEVHVICYDAGRVKRFQGYFGKVWEAIKSGVYYPAPSQMNCCGCGYKSACNTWTGHPKKEGERWICLY